MLSVIVIIIIVVVVVVVFIIVVVCCFRKEYSSYLCRPDHKQEFISQWQANYNNLEPHLRCQDVMKAELHHRVDVRHSTTPEI